jgi:hypothetical protein
MVLRALDDDGDNDATYDMDIKISSDKLNSMKSVTAVSVMSNTKVELQNAVKEIDSTIAFEANDRSARPPHAYKHLVKIFRNAPVYSKSAVNAGRDREVVLDDRNASTTHTPVSFNAQIDDSSITCSSYVWTENGNTLSSEKKFIKNNFEIGTHDIKLTATCNGKEKTDIRVITVNPLSDVRKTILDEHNDRRGREYTGYKLSYDVRLEQSSEDWDNYAGAYTIWNHAVNLGFDVDEGENLAASSTGAMTFEQAMDGWYDSEKPGWDYENNKGNGKTGQTGHYTQVVWQTSYKVGCASTLYNENKHPVNHKAVDSPWNLLGCRYKEAGNVGTSHPFCRDDKLDVELAKAIKPNMLLTLDMFKDKTIRFTKTTRDFWNCTAPTTQGDHVATMNFTTGGDGKMKFTINNFYYSNDANNTAEYTFQLSNLGVNIQDDGSLIALHDRGYAYAGAAYTNRLILKAIAEDDTYLYVEASWRYQNPDVEYIIYPSNSGVFKLFKNDLE